jgi:5-methylcytosine-specific restriction endonuclease McrBC regulatory subunit McrC
VYRVVKNNNEKQAAIDSRPLVQNIVKALTRLETKIKCRSGPRKIILDTAKCKKLFPADAMQKE